MRELCRFDISIKQGIVRYKVLVVGKNGKLTESIEVIESLFGFQLFKTV